MNLLPKARAKNVVVQKTENGIVVYDIATRETILLNQTEADVFQNCDGKTSIIELAAELKLTIEMIQDILDNLKNKNLLEHGNICLSGKTVGYKTENQKPDL